MKKPLIAIMTLVALSQPLFSQVKPDVIYGSDKTPNPNASSTREESARARRSPWRARIVAASPTRAAATRATARIRFSTANPFPLP